MLYNMVENRPLTVVSELKVLINLTKVLEKSLFLVGPEVWEPWMQMYVSIRLLQATSYASMLISEYLWEELNRKKKSDTIHLKA